MGDFTQEGLRRLEDRLREAEDENAAALHSLGQSAEADSNTWHDNAAFDEANRRIRAAANRMGKIKQTLLDATVVEKPSDGSVGVGCDVTYRFVGDDETETAHIAGVHAVRSEEDKIQVMSSASPLGAAMLGKKIGDVVTFTAPTGKKLQVTILDVI